MIQGGYQGIIILPIKRKMAAAKKRSFCAISVFYWIFTSVIQSPGFTNDYKFGISVSTLDRSRHSNLNFAHHFVIYWLFQNSANKNQHQNSYQRETVSDKFVVFFKRHKKSIGWAKYVYVCEWDMCWINFCNFSLVTKNVKSRSKIAPFFKWAPFWNLISKKENNYVFLK